MDFKTMNTFPGSRLRGNDEQMQGTCRFRPRITFEAHTHID